jgi:hypothetical protein
MPTIIPGRQAARIEFPKQLHPTPPPSISTISGLTTQPTDTYKTFKINDILHKSKFAFIVKIVNRTPENPPKIPDFRFKIQLFSLPEQ